MRQSRLYLDFPILLMVMGLILVGVVTLYSASGQSLAVVKQQSVRALVALVLMCLTARLSPSVLMRWTPFLYGVGLLFLVAVEVIGVTGKGAQRWLDIGLVRFQPSELMKLCVPMMVSWFLARHPLPANWKRVLISLLIIAVPCLLIAVQPDLGTAILVASAGFFVLFLGGLSWRLMLSMVPIFGAAGALSWRFLLHDYQRQRVLTFLNPESDPLGAGYHIIQSKIAIGSGGIFGKGWLNGTQSRLNFLPERSTDFIFSAFSEEFGFLGAALLLSFYLALIFRSLYIAVHAQDTYSRLVCGSFALTLFVYVVVNVGMVSGLLPVVGLPLPLVSYGGTSMVVLMISLGVVMSIHTHRRLYAS